MELPEAQAAEEEAALTQAALYASGSADRNVLAAASAGAFNEAVGVGEVGTAGKVARIANRGGVLVLVLALSAHPVRVRGRNDAWPGALTHATGEAGNVGFERASPCRSTEQQEEGHSSESARKQWCCRRCKLKLMPRSRTCKLHS